MGDDSMSASEQEQPRAAEQRRAAASNGDRSQAPKGRTADGTSKTVAGQGMLSADLRGVVAHHAPCVPECGTCYPKGGASA